MKIRSIGPSVCGWFPPRTAGRFRSYGRMRTFAGLSQVSPTGGSFLHRWTPPWHGLFWQRQARGATAPPSTWESSTLHLPKGFVMISQEFTIRRPHLGPFHSFGELIVLHGVPKNSCKVTCCAALPLRRQTCCGFTYGFSGTP